MKYKKTRYKVHLNIEPPSFKNTEEYFKIMGEIVREEKLIDHISVLTGASHDLKWDAFDYLRSFKGEYIWECFYDSPFHSRDASYLRRRGRFEKWPKVWREGRLVLPTEISELEKFVDSPSKNPISFDLFCVGEVTDDKEGEKIEARLKLQRDGKFIRVDYR